MKEKTNRFLNFNDGIVEIYRVDNGAENGNRNVEVLKFRDRMRFKSHTVGLKRFYEAMQFEINITKAIIIPEPVTKISTQDIAVIEGKRYKIEQIQERRETLPPSLLLSLSDTEEVLNVEL